MNLRSYPQAVIKASEALEKKKKEELSVIDPAKARNLAITLGSIKVRQHRVDLCI